MSSHPAPLVGSWVTIALSLLFMSVIRHWHGLHLFSLSSVAISLAMGTPLSIVMWMVTRQRDVLRANLSSGHVSIKRTSGLNTSLITCNISDMDIVVLKCHLQGRRGYHWQGWSLAALIQDEPVFAFSLRKTKEQCTQDAEHLPLLFRDQIIARLRSYVGVLPL